MRGAFVGERGARAAKAKVELAEVLGSRHLRLDARDGGAGVDERGESRVRDGAFGADVEEGSLAGDQLEDAVATGGGGVELAADANGAIRGEPRRRQRRSLDASARVGAAEGDGGEGARALLLGSLELTRGLRGEESLVGRGGARDGFVRGRGGGFRGAETMKSAGTELQAGVRSAGRSRRSSRDPRIVK